MRVSRANTNCLFMFFLSFFFLSCFPPSIRFHHAEMTTTTTTTTPTDKPATDTRQRQDERVSLQPVRLRGGHRTDSVRELARR